MNHFRFNGSTLMGDTLGVAGAGRDNGVALVFPISLVLKVSADPLVDPRSQRLIVNESSNSLIHQPHGGSDVPLFCLTIAVSAALMEPFAFISERKFVASTA